MPSNRSRRRHPVPDEAPHLPAAAPEAAMPAPPPAPPEEFQEQVVVSKRFCPQTGGPKVAILFRTRHPETTQEYTLDVRMAEAITERILLVCREHRTRFSDDWLGPAPAVGPDSGP